MKVISRLTNLVSLVFVVPVVIYTLTGCATPAGVAAEANTDMQLISTLGEQMEQCLSLHDTGVEEIECTKEKMQQASILLGAGPDLWEAEIAKMEEVARKYDAGYYDTKEKEKALKREFKIIFVSFEKKGREAFAAYVQRKRVEMAQAQRSQEAAKVAGQALGVAAAVGAGYAAANTAPTMPMPTYPTPSVPSFRGNGFNTTTYVTDSGLKYTHCRDNVCLAR